MAVDGFKRDGDKFLRTADGKFVGNCDCCGVPDSCPCSASEWDDLVDQTITSCAGIVREYELSGYSDCDLTPCAICTTPSLPHKGWEGRFRATNADCVWGGIATIVGPGSDTICAKEWVASKTTLRLNPTAWAIKIQCQHLGDCDVWSGEKSTGTTPVGIYTRTSGNDTTSSLTIVEV